MFLLLKIMIIPFIILIGVALMEVKDPVSKKKKEKKFKSKWD